MMKKAVAQTARIGIAPTTFEFKTIMRPLAPAMISTTIAELCEQTHRSIWKTWVGVVAKAGSTPRSSIATPLKDQSRHYKRTTLMRPR